MVYSNCIPDCPICKGLGFIRAETEGIHDPNFGKVFECPNRKLTRWDNSIGIGLDDAKKLNWDLFVQTDAIIDMRRAYDKLFQNGYGWIYICGNPGNGKTIMAKASVIHAVMYRDIAAKYTKLSTLINDLRASYDEERGQSVYAQRLKDIRAIDYLVIDELGRDRQTDFSKQSLSDIMDSRYEDAANKKSLTVWVSNFKPEEILEQYQYDRVRDGRFTVLEITDSSNRPAIRYKENEGSIWWNEI